MERPAVPTALGKSRDLASHALGALFILLVIASVSSTVWLIVVIVRSLSAPVAWISIASIAGMLTVLLIHLARREGKSIESFLRREQVNDFLFLASLGLLPQSEHACVALEARNLFATLGQVPGWTLRRDDRFYPDLGKLPFYDSIDMLSIVFQLEKSLDLHIPKGEAENVLRIIGGRGNSGTVGEATLETIAMYKRCLALPCNAGRGQLRSTLNTPPS
jgi:hypothetical protein